MAVYHFDYWFEWLCDEEHCPCLWSADDITREKYDYSVDLHELPVSANLIQFLCETGMEHDSALDWDYPANPLRWTPEEENRFYQKAKEGFLRLRQELGEDYQITYCEKQ